MHLYGHKPGACAQMLIIPHTCGKIQIILCMLCNINTLIMSHNCILRELYSVFINSIKYADQYSYTLDKKLYCSMLNGGKI